jgi:hypothetical protein
MLAHVLRLARPVRDVSLHDLPRCLGLTPLFPLLPLHNDTLFAAAFAMAAVGLVTAVAASLSSSPLPLSVLLYGGRPADAGAPQGASAGRTMHEWLLPASLAMTVKLAKMYRCAMCSCQRRCRCVCGRIRVVAADDEDVDSSSTVSDVVSAALLTCSVSTIVLGVTASLTPMPSASPLMMLPALPDLSAAS